MSCQPNDLNAPWPPPSAHSPAEWRRIVDAIGLPPHYAEYLDPLIHKMARERRREDGEPEPWDPNFVSIKPEPDDETSDAQRTTRFAKSLAEVIRAKRFTSGRPLRGVALNASMTKFTLSHLERGTRAMTVDELARIAHSLDCPIEDLVELAVARMR